MIQGAEPRDSEGRGCQQGVEMRGEGRFRGGGGGAAREGCSGERADRTPRSAGMQKGHA